MKKIRIKNLVGDDEFLNGRTGRLTKPFGCFPIGDVGVYLDDKSGVNMGICNLLNDEYEIIK